MADEKNKKSGIFDIENMINLNIPDIDEKFKISDFNKSPIYDPIDPLSNLPEFKFVDMSLEEVSASSTLELLKILNEESEKYKGALSHSMARIIVNELKFRQMKADHENLIDEMKKNNEQIINTINERTRPHWSTTPNFWVVLLTLILTAIAIFVTLNN